MNKFGLFVVLAAVCSFSSASAETCSPDDGGAFNDIKFIDMTEACTAATKDQIKMEITASLQYMKMGTHFAQDKINRPGFAKFFFAAASEEREHAYKLIEYLSMRGRYIVDGKTLPNIDISGLVRNPSVEGVQLAEIDTGLTALQNALKLEVKVTDSIRKLIKKCEGDETDKFNHYHFVDYLTGEFLEEQYKGQRELAGKISTLAKMMKNEPSKELAEFLFDKQQL